MPAVHLDDEEWQKVMAIIATASWTVANPLLLKIGEQLRMQSEQRRADGPMAAAGSSTVQPSESKHN
jgi:hypothetical protein